MGALTPSILAQRALADRHTRASLATLAKHKRAGTFDRDRALRLLENNARDAARVWTAYHWQGREQWHEIWPYSVRQACALILLQHIPAE